VFADDGFEPAEITVNGRKERRVVAVLEKGGRRVRVLDLGFRGDEGGKRVEGEGDGEGEEGDSASGTDFEMME
jgi:anaphase-promoting complex subunit 4